MNHALNIVAGVMTVIAHAAPAAAGPDPLATDAAAAAACFDVDMAGLSAQADPTGPFDGIAVTRIDDELLLVSTSAATTNDLSIGHIEATSHTLTFPSAPGRPWDGAVVVTIDEVQLLPTTPGIHPLLSVLTAVTGATGVINTSEGSFVDLTDPAGGRASWIVEGELCFGEQP